MSISPKFPINPSDGDEILDKYGNRWIYYSSTKSWISKGKIESYSVVSENSDGLIDPALYERLNNLRSLSNAYDLQSSLKIRPGTDAYWYYFRSSDKLFRFKPEGESVLRIEVDKARLYQILLKNRRPGPRGVVGETGETGPDGLSGTSVCDADGGELSYKASTVDGNRLDFSIFTPVPLYIGGPIDLPNNHVPDISVRLFKILKPISDNQLKDPITSLAKAYGSYDNIKDKFGHVRHLLSAQSMGMKVEEIICNIPLSQLMVNPGQLSAAGPHVAIDINPIDTADIKISTVSTISIDIDKTKASIRYDSNTSIVCGSIFLTSGVWDINSWCLRSRQRGPDGDNGDAGGANLDVVIEDLDNSNIHATCPIVNVRYDAPRNYIHTHCADLLAEAIVPNVKILPQSSTISSSKALNSVFAAAQPVIEESKYVYRYIPELKDFRVPPLDLTHWAPQPGVFTKRHFAKHKFDWIPRTDVPECDDRGTWYDERSTRAGVYPWGIEQPNTPPKDTCNQEPFFYFPSLQDTPCPGEPPISQVKSGGSYTPSIQTEYLTKSSTIDGGVY